MDDLEEASSSDGEELETRIDEIATVIRCVLKHEEPLVLRKDSCNNGEISLHLGLFCIHHAGCPVKACTLFFMPEFLSLNVTLGIWFA